MEAGGRAGESGAKRRAGSVVHSQSLIYWGCDIKNIFMLGRQVTVVTMLSTNLSLFLIILPLRYFP